MVSRTGILFLTAGSLALLTSGVFAVAPYVAFLSSVAALNIAAPFIFTLFVLSAVVIAFSYKMIKQNKKSKENPKAEVKEELEAKKNREKIGDLEKKVVITSENFATKDEVDGLKKEVSDLSAKLINSTATQDEVEEKLNIAFYTKGQERGWNTTFGDIILPNDTREKLKEICESKSGGYLLYGPPGTGKSTIGKAIANQTKSLSAFISISASCLSNKSNIDQVFEKAETNSPCIIFIDEIDGIGGQRTGNKDAGPLTHLLTKLDGFSSGKNITVVAATNHKNHLDPALIRGGRLGIHINVSALERDKRRKILKEHLGDLSVKNIETILTNTDGFSVANLIALMDLIKNKKNKGEKISSFHTLCNKFKKDHNTKDENNNTRKSSSESLSSSRSLSSRSLSTSSSVSSSLSDVFLQENTPAISNITTQP